MADTKISALTALTGANTAADDLFAIVDTSATTTKSIRADELKSLITGSTTLSGATVTTSSPLANLAQTWNAGAVTFKGLVFNVTDTASASASLLMDLQVGGSSLFSVDKSANVKAKAIYSNTGGVANGFFLAASSGTQIVAYTNNGTTTNAFSTAGFKSSDSGYISWVSSGDPTGVPDTYLTRSAAASLRLGAADAAAPVAQTLGVQSVVAGTSNTAGVNFTIKGSAGTGTGLGGSIIFQVAPVGSSGTAQNAFATALTIASDKSATFVGVITAQSGMAVSGNILLSTNNGQLYFGASNDVALARDAANTLALRNGTAAQQFNIYNTYDGTNNEYIRIWYSANVAYIQTVGAGTGSSRQLSIGPVGAAPLVFRTSNTDRWNVDGSGNFIASADNTYDIGASGANRPRNLFIAGQIKSSIALTMETSAGSGVGVGFYTPSDGTVRVANYGATDFGRMMFGGTTSSFPALKRSSATLQARLADDSAFAAIQGKLTTDTAYTAGSAGAATGYIVIYDSTGTAYKVEARV